MQYLIFMRKNVSIPHRYAQNRQSRYKMPPHGFASLSSLQQLLGTFCVVVAFLLSSITGHYYAIGDRRRQEFL